MDDSTEGKPGIRYRLERLRTRPHRYESANNDEALQEAAKEMGLKFPFTPDEFRRRAGTGIFREDTPERFFPAKGE